MPVYRAQEIFRDALQTKQLELRVHRPPTTTPDASRSTAPLAASRNVPQPPARSPTTTISTSGSSLPEHETVHDPKEGQNSQSLMQANTRKLGKRINIELTKGRLSSAI